MGNDDIGHRQYRPQPYRPHRTPYRPQAKSISATRRYRPHNIGHKGCQCSVSVTRQCLPFSF